MTPTIPTPPSTGKAATMTPETPDFSDWTTDRLLRQRRHLEAILAVSAGQADPERPQLRAEHRAVCAEITRRTSEADLMATEPRKD